VRPALAALVAIAVLVGCGRPRSVDRDRIRFSHAPHAAAGVTCTACHADAARPGAVVLPPEARCRACHTRAPERRCAYCHSAPLAPQRYARADRELRFSHERHAPRVDGNCMACHGVGADTRTVRRFEPTIPTMDGCASRCHGEDLRALACARCHASLRRYAIDEVSVVRHGPGFARHHGAEARAAGPTCAQCHDPTFCARCHAAMPGLPVADLDPLSVTRDFVHRGDFMARHPEESRFGTVTCARCHGVDFCDGCHRASGVGGGVGPASAHPPGWLNPASPNGHAREARRNLLSCASCHESDATQVCVPCHRVGGAAPHPHPPGFQAAIDARQHSVCTVCHGVGP
jgi:hypothetical protein